MFLFVKKRLDTKKSNRFSHYFFIFSGIGRNIQNDSPLSIQFDTLFDTLCFFSQNKKARKACK